MRIALLSNVTVEVLAGMLKKEHSVWLAPGFGAWMETSLDVPASLKAFAPEVIYILLDDHFAGARTWRQDEVKSAVKSLSTTFAQVPIVVPNIAQLAADFGEEFYSIKMWRLASMPFSLLALNELKKLFTYKKALCLDLDNTLWRGVIGEDGVAGIAMEFDFQRRVQALQRRGVILIALSRNNPEDVEEVWHLERMILKRSDFVALAINWQDKAQNLAQIARRLNLGPEAFVFADDNPSERMQMRAMLPEVCTAAFPPDLEVYFPSWPVTGEDAAKTLQYQAEQERCVEAGRLSAGEYLRRLELRSEIHFMREGESARVAQLSQKTNQFNVCTNRYTQADIDRFAADASRILLTMHAGDRFGDLGLIAFVQVALVGESLAKAEILDWVMSCRAMNRRLEFALEKELETLLCARGVKSLCATWRKTPKNAPVKNLFDDFGFTLDSVTDDERRYVKTLFYCICFLFGFMA